MRTRRFCGLLVYKMGSDSLKPHLFSLMDNEMMFHISTRKP